VAARSHDPSRPQIGQLDAIDPDGSEDFRRVMTMRSAGPADQSWGRAHPEELVLQLYRAELLIHDLYMVPSETEQMRRG